MLELPLDMLQARARDEGWDSMRLEHLKSSAVDAAEAILKETVVEPGDDDLERHLKAADAAVRMGEHLILALTNDQTTADDLKLIRARIEAFRSLAEGLEMVIKTSRQVRGIKSDQPSKAPEKESTRIIYATIVEKARSA